MKVPSAAASSRFVVAAVGALLISLSGCTNRGDDGDPSSTGPGSQNNSSGGEAAGGAGTHDGPTQAEGAVEPPLLAFTRENVRLLPFDTRLARVAAVLKLPPSDALFDELRAHRVELGDPDYGKATNSDYSWSSTRIRLWMKLLRPICESAQMKKEYPGLASNSGKLIQAALGRDADRPEIDFIRAKLDETALPAARPLLVCLGVMSSLEFVAR